MHHFTIQLHHAVINSTFFSNKTIKAGDNKSYKISFGEAVKILTGAILPTGVDTIAMFEDCSKKGEKVYVPPGIKKNINYRPVGENIRKNEIILKYGTKIGSSEIAQTASAGISKVFVKEKV